MILFISYASGTKGSSTAIWADDKIKSIESLNYPVTILTNISSSLDINKYKIYKIPSISRKDLKKEISNSENNSLILKIFFYPLSIIFGNLIDLIIGFFTKGHGESRWSWSIPSFIVGLFIMFKHKPKVIYSTGGAGSAHLVAILLKKFFFSKKLIIELQDPLVGNDIGRNKNNLKYFKFIEKKIVKYSDKVIFVTNQAAKECIKRNQNSNIFSIYSGSWNYHLNNKNSTINNNQKKIKFIHLGTLYGNRNMNNLLRAIDELIHEKFIKSSEIEILNLGEIYCKEKKYYLSKNYFKQFDIKSRLEGLKVLNEYHICLLIQHKDQRSKITIPYKFYDYINSNKKILGIIDNIELKVMLDNSDNFSANCNDYQDIKRSIKSIYKKKLSTYQSNNLNINILTQVKIMFDGML